MSALLKYLTGSDDPEIFDKAVEALARDRHIARLQAAWSDDLSCAECQAHLAEYTQAVDLTSSLTAELQKIAQHLAHCEDCLSIFSALQTFSRDGEVDRPAVVPTPKPDLSFLSSSSAHPVAEWWRQVEASTKQLATELQIMVSRTVAQFVALPGGLAPLPIPMPVMRDPAVSGSSERLTLPDTSGNLIFELTVSPVAAHAQISLGVLYLDSRQPAAQITVTLLNAQHQLLRRMDTGEDGQAVFSGLAPGRYYLRARTGDEQWELAFVLNEIESS